MKKNLFRTKYIFLGTAFLSVTLFLLSSRAVAIDKNEEISVITANEKNNNNIFVAVDTRVDNVFDALSVKLGKAIISSAEVKKRKVTGDFNMADPEKTLRQLTVNMALNWFNDGQSLYIFANTELQNEIIQLRFAPYQELISYLKTTGLYDERYPARAKYDAGSFYVAGPPIYVELIKAAAKYLDETYMQEKEFGIQDIRVIRLKNTFVNDRAYAMRGDLINVPGVATAINSLLNSRAEFKAQISANAAAEGLKDGSDGNYQEVPYATSERSNGKKIVEAGGLSIVAYRDTNSLLVKGSSSQVRYIEQLINTLDVPKQQIELSVWVIDIAKSHFTELGVRWQANFTTANAAIRFNSSELDVINGAKFLANVNALSSKGDAQVISRPIILTQENVPAVFDNNTTFYAKLIGERNSSLEDITYGTLVSVLPRVSFKGKEIEMIINIEDGSLKYSNTSQREEVDNLPMVGRTTISSVARVPRDSSLLIGGYTREQNENKVLKIPLLGDIPLIGALFRYKSDSKQQMVRIFLIQPKLLNFGEEWNGSVLQENPILSSNLKLRQTVNMLKNYVSQ